MKSKKKSAPAGTTLVKIERTIRAIPRGKVSTYGRVARAAGCPGAARMVARVLRRSYGLPWQRVLGAGGQIKLTGDAAIEQRLRLEAEGVRFRGRKVDMKGANTSSRSRRNHKKRKSDPGLLRQSATMVQSRAVEAASTKSQVENSSIFGGLLTLVIACALVYAGWRIVPPSDVEDTANAPEPEAASPSAASPGTDCEDRQGPVMDLAKMEERNILWVVTKKKSGERADFRSADLRCVDLRDYHFEGANLRGADLTGADLTGADLSGADLQGADLSYAILEQAKLAGADLSSAYLKGASLSHADLTSAILHDANFTQANLSYANLHSADLDPDTDLESADVESVTFEPKNLPATENTYLARNLSRLTYGEPREMVVLRNAFHTDGYTDQERRVTYAIQRQQTRTEWEQCRKGSSGRSCAVAVAKWLVYDKTFQYGVNPDRPLYLAIGLWLWCSVIYVSILESVREPVILRFQRNDGATDYPGTPVVPADLSATTAWPVVCREAKIWWTALFFSLESALNIGFGEFQPGRWLRILATTDYELKAVGWTRTLSGAQSLFSLLMFALAIWGLFGQPFSG